MHYECEQKQHQAKNFYLLHRSRIRFFSSFCLSYSNKCWYGYIKLTHIHTQKTNQRKTTRNQKSKKAGSEKWIFV